MTVCSSVLVPGCSSAFSADNKLQKCVYNRRLLGGYDDLKPPAEWAADAFKSRNFTDRWIYSYLSIYKPPRLLPG